MRFCMSCNGSCQKYRAKKPDKNGRYSEGQKRCNICDLFMIWDGLFCPCCNYQLRSKPRYIKYKEKIIKLARI